MTLTLDASVHRVRANAIAPTSTPNFMYLIPVKIAVSLAEVHRLLKLTKLATTTFIKP